MTQSDGNKAGVNAEISRLAEALLRNQRSQYASCESLEFLHHATGIVMILASGFATVFLGLKWPNFEIVSPVASLIALTAGSLQTFSRFEQRSRDHKQSAVNFGQLHRAARSRVCGAYTEEENRDYLETLLIGYASASDTAPLTWYAKRKKQETLRAGTAKL